MTFLCLETSLQTQKGHALTQSLKGTGYGLDFEVKEMTLLFCFFTEALHGASSNAGWQCQILCGFAWSQFFSFDFRTPGRTCNDIEPAIADQCLDGWHCQRPFLNSGSLPELITQ